MKVHLVRVDRDPQLRFGRFASSATPRRSAGGREPDEAQLRTALLSER